MGGLNINGCRLSPLKVIPKAGGSVLHALKMSDVGYSGFGEVYFSSAGPGITSDWKRHKRMTLNLIVPVGEIKFVLLMNELVHQHLGTFLRFCWAEGITIGSLFPQIFGSLSKALVKLRVCWPILQIWSMIL